VRDLNGAKQCVYKEIQGIGAGGVWKNWKTNLLK
jgi:hypothetical protein